MVTFTWERGRTEQFIEQAEEILTQNEKIDHPQHKGEKEKNFDVEFIELQSRSSSK